MWKPYQKDTLSSPLLSLLHSCESLFHLRGSSQKTQHHTIVQSITVKTQENPKKWDGGLLLSLPSFRLDIITTTCITTVYPLKYCCPRPMGMHTPTVQTCLYRLENLRSAKHCTIETKIFMKDHSWCPSELISFSTVAFSMTYDLHWQGNFRSVCLHGRCKCKYLSLIYFLNTNEAWNQWSTDWKKTRTGSLYCK